MPSSEQKILAAACHIGYLLGGVTFILLPLIVFFGKSNDYFVRSHAKQALVAQVCVGLASATVSVLTSILIGILLWPLLLIIVAIFFIFSLKAAWTVFSGEYYEYPFIRGIAAKL